MRAPTNNLARQVRSDERGFTLVEMLTGITIGLIITIAAWQAVDIAYKAQSRTAMRVDATNRGRNAMEAISRAVRSQQCYNNVRPMLWASGTGMEFYSSVAPSGASASVKQPVERHRIEWTGGSDTSADVGRATSSTPLANVGNIVEKVWRANAAGVLPAATATPTTTNIIARDVQVAPDRRNSAQTAPIFRYFKYAGTTGSGRVDLTAPVATTTSTVYDYNRGGLPSASSTDLAGIVLVEVSYQVVPRRQTAAESASMNFYNTISVRIADPTNPAGSPQCL